MYGVGRSFMADIVQGIAKRWIFYRENHGFNAKNFPARMREFFIRTHTYIGFMFCTSSVMRGLLRGFIKS